MDKEGGLGKLDRALPHPALSSALRAPLGLRSTWRVWGVAYMYLPCPHPEAIAGTRLGAESLGHQTVKMGPRTSVSRQGVGRGWLGTWGCGSPVWQ